MPTLSLDALEPHPDNANCMTAATMKKLIEHIKRSGDYPPLIVRRHPTMPDRFQILDGHHRAQALRELGYDAARCEIWDADDDRAALLLLTLNRLHGEDDPQRRGALLRQLNSRVDIEQLARWLPEDSERIRKLMDLCAAPPAPVAPPQLDGMPQAVTFFMTGAQREALLTRLNAVGGNRSAALLLLAGVNVVAN